MTNGRIGGEGLVRNVPGKLPELSDLDDEQIVKLYLDSDRRDESYFQELLRRRQREVWLTCLRFLGLTQDADDMTQEVFIQVYRRLPQFRGEAPFRSWIRSIAKNLCKNELRRRSRRLRTQPGAETSWKQAVDPQPGPENEAMFRDRQQRLASALSHLSEGDAQLLAVVTNKEMTYADLARELGISKSALKMKVLRIRLRLREHLDNEERTATP